MSITDELRKWASIEVPYKYGNQLIAIADRIDAEHERQLEVLYRDMSDTEYVELPKDADGEYIHEHDKVDWRDHAGTWHENATVVAVCDDGCYVMHGIVFHVHKSDIRHHHIPTVEDVLLDACRAYHSLMVESMNDVAHDMPAPSEIIAEYAKRLKLAGEDE